MDAELSSSEKKINEANIASYKKSGASTSNSERKKIAEDETTVTAVVKKAVKRKIDIIAASEGLELSAWLVKHLDELSEKVNVTVSK